MNRRVGLGLRGRKRLNMLRLRLRMKNERCRNGRNGDGLRGRSDRG